MDLVATYKQYQALILFIAAWLLSIPTGILIARWDRRLEKRSREREILSIIFRYERVVNRRVEIQRSLNTEPQLEFEFVISRVLHSDNFKVILVVFGMSVTQMLSSPIVTAVYGKTVSNIYFWTILFLTFVLTTGLMIAEQIDGNIDNDAIHIKEYKSKIVARLVELNCDSSVLNRLDKIEILYGLRIE
jgi:hypothetical protein